MLNNYSDSQILKALQYAKENRKKHLDGFFDFLKIPSISTDPMYTESINNAAKWLVNELNRIGMNQCQSISTDGHPVVYGEWLNAGSNAPTVLVYAHYDVQPVDPLELWETPPFEPSIRSENIYARGTVDDKCGVFINLKAFESMLSTSGRLPVNIKILFEGEEEVGSPNLEKFIKNHKDLLDADFLLVCDGGSMPDQPLLITSIRGVCGAEVNITGPKQDLHSGNFGGIAHNPVHMVGKIIASLHDDEGRVQIPGFYENVHSLSEKQKAQIIEEGTKRESYFRNIMGDKPWWGVLNYSLIERATAQPTADVNGVSGGYQGKGSKTIIPSKAGFKITFRLVADQNPDDIYCKFQHFVNGFYSDTLDINVENSMPIRLLNKTLIPSTLLDRRRRYERSMIDRRRINYS